MIEPTKKQKKQADKLLRQALKEINREFILWCKDDKNPFDFFLKKLALQKMMLDQSGVYMNMTNEKFMLVFEKLGESE